MWVCGRDCAILYRTLAEREERKVLVQAGADVSGRVFTPEEVRSFSYHDNYHPPSIHSWLEN